MPQSERDLIVPGAWIQSRSVVDNLTLACHRCVIVEANIWSGIAFACILGYEIGTLLICFVDWDSREINLSNLSYDIY